MPFVVPFQKMGPNLGAIIIGAEVTHNDASTIDANFSYVAGDVGSPRGGAPPPGAWPSACHVGKVGTIIIGAEVTHSGAMAPRLGSIF
jgi:hypothetical protein